MCNTHAQSSLISVSLGSAQTQSNLTVRNYPSGHMVYLDNASRTAMKADFSTFYGEARTHIDAIKAAIQPEQTVITGVARFRRRSNRTPY